TPPRPPCSQHDGCNVRSNHQRLGKMAISTRKRASWSNRPILLPRLPSRGLCDDENVSAVVDPARLPAQALLNLLEFCHELLAARQSTDKTTRPIHVRSKATVEDIDRSKIKDDAVRREKRS